MFGCPGSGKGTQGIALGQIPNLRHLAMGDIFRGLDKASDIGREILSYSTKGLLVPDELTVRVFQHHLSNAVDSQRIDPSYHFLLLDGIPRTPRQVEQLSGTIDVKRIIHLVIDDREGLIARLAGRAKKSNRPDDADRSVIENRIDVYERETAPVLGAYPRSLVARVNADQHPLGVLRDISSELVSVVPGNI
jgi:adenylate kinase